MEISNELRNLVDPNSECCCEHSLGNKCKEWVNKQGYWANSGYDNKYYCMLRDMPDNKWFYADTEVEAIFKACEWILENKDNK